MYDAAGADELTFLDITASHENRDTIYDVVSRTAANVFLPLTVGGGIRSTGDMRKLLLAGADKCSMNSAAIARPALIAEAGGEVRQPVCRGGGRTPACARRANGRCSPTAAATRPGSMWWSGASRRRAWARGEILLTSMDRDGTGTGFDLDLLRAVCGAVRLPVVASGGVGTVEHFVEGARAGATGLLAASVFHFGSLTIPGVKQALSAAGLPVRLPLRA